MLPPRPGEAPLTGRRLSHYRVLERVGTGGMGDVYRARDEHLHRDVAVKVLRAGCVVDTAARHRLRKEALALSRLNHPNIATVYDFDHEDEVDFVAMEYVPGRSLAEAGNAGPIGERELVDLGCQLAEGLAAAHEQGVVHGDIKPANLRLTPERRLKILDFGLAELSQPVSDTATTTSVSAIYAPAGTLPYMAPEQLQGRPPDVGTDIYSVGVVLYQLASGLCPFRQPSPALLMRDILSADPPPLHAAGAALSPALERVIATCLQKDASRRYPSAAALLGELRNCAAGAAATRETTPARLHTDDSTRAVPEASIATRAVGRLVPTRAGKSARSNRARTTLAVLVPAAAALLVLLVWLPRQQPTLAFATRDWLLVADFENRTGEEVFDKTLETALRISIEQSSYVNVVPKRRIADVLRRMKRENARLDEPTAREIAERESIRAILLPGISGVGGTYVLSATLENPATGASVRSEMVQAKGRAEVFHALDVLGKSIRRSLGESMASVTRQARPLSAVTTASLEALKQYTLGIDSHRAGRREEARRYYENALRIDPSFVAAQASLGMIDYENFDAANGKELLTRAVRLVSGLTEKERLGILAFHARAVENDIPKAVGYLESLLAIYPDYTAAHNNLGWYYQQMGRYEDAVREYREAIRTDPTLILARDGEVIVRLFYLGQPKVGLDACRARLAVDDRDGPAWSMLGWAYLGEGDLDRAVGAFEEALKRAPRRTLDWYRLGHIHRLRGEYADALKDFGQVMRIEPEDASAYYDSGVVRRLMKDEAGARRDFRRFQAAVEKRLREQPGNEDRADRYFELAMAALRLGDEAKAEALAAKAAALNPKEHFGMAAFRAAQGRASEALQHLEAAIQGGFRNYIFLTIHSDFDRVRGDPRFAALMARVLQR